MNATDVDVDRLCCPATHARLHISDGLPQPTAEPLQEQYGPVSSWLLSEGDGTAYPVLDSKHGRIPLLFPPLGRRPAQAQSPSPRSSTPASDPSGRGAFASLQEERQFYDESALLSMRAIDRQWSVAASNWAHHRATFPEPVTVWVDSPFGAPGQLAAYTHLSSLPQGDVLQVGGKGTHAVKFLVAGAARATLLSPILTELLHAYAMADRFGLADRLTPVLGAAEAMPFPDEIFSHIYLGGSLHHTDTDLAVPEIQRVLVPGGLWASNDPWKAVGHVTGTRALGKQEVGVWCEPLDSRRITPALRTFDKIEILHSGLVSRYALIALSKMRIKASVSTALVIMDRCDRIFRKSLEPSRHGSLVTIMGMKSGQL